MAKFTEVIDVGFATLRIEKTVNCVAQKQIATQLNNQNISGTAGCGAGTAHPFMGSPRGVALCALPINGALDSISDARTFLCAHPTWEDLNSITKKAFLDIGVRSKTYNLTLERYTTCKANHTMRAQKHADVRFTTYFKHLSRKPLVLGFDTEWYEVDNKRILLSAQFSTSIDGIMYDFVFYNNTELSLGSCLYYIVNIYFKGFGFCLSNKGRSHHKNPTFDSSKITLVGHFSGVDYSMFKDWCKIFEYTSPTQNVLGKIKTVEQQMENLMQNIKCCAGSDDDDAKARKAKDMIILQDRLDSLKKDSRHATNVIVQNKHIVFSTSDRVLNYRIHNNLRCEFRLRLRDTMALSSANSSLAELGESLGIPKLDTIVYDKMYGKPVNYFKSHMNELLNVDFEFFMAYAIRDSRIAYEWYNAIVNEYGDGVTISAIGAREALHFIEKNLLLEYEDVRGYREKYDDLYNNTRGKLSTLPNNCYIGGRNECFTFGLVRGVSYDLDLRSAYPLAMQTIPAIDWSKLLTEFPDRHVFSLKDFKNPSQPGFGYVDFVFPEEVKYPTIPVMCDGIPVFPQTGVNIKVCFPEIFAAVVLGATVTVNGVYYVPHATDDIHPLGMAMENLVKIRDEISKTHGKKSPQALRCKLINNSVYGKTGQGIHDKSVRNFLTDEMTTVEEARITDAVMASTITAVVRQILGLIMNFLSDKGYLVHSVTTDGFITDFPKNRHSEIDDYIFGLNPNFQDIINRCFGGGSIIEIKHEQDMRGFYNIKTRGNVAFSSDGVFAKAGYRGSDSFRFADKDTRRKMFIDLYTNRCGRVQDEVNNMHSLYLLKNGKAKQLIKYFVDEEDKVKHLSLDADAKRYITHRGIQDYFETRPFYDITEYTFYKKQLELFYKMGHNLKDEFDLKGLHHALKYGFPENYPHINPKIKLTTNEMAEHIKRKYLYKMRQGLLFIKKDDFNDDVFIQCQGKMGFFPTKRCDFIDEVISYLGSYTGISASDAVGVWKNVGRKDNFNFDYLTALKFWYGYLSCVHFDGMYEDL